MEVAAAWECVSAGSLVPRWVGCGRRWGAAGGTPRAEFLQLIYERNARSF